MIEKLRRYKKIKIIGNSRNGFHYTHYFDMENHLSKDTMELLENSKNAVLLGKNNDSDKWELIDEKSPSFGCEDLEGYSSIEEYNQAVRRGDVPDYILDIAAKVTDKTITSYFNEDI